jgi:hypothetical protein
MKNFTSSITVLVILLAAMPSAYGRDTKLMLPIDAAMGTKDAEDKLEGSVKFFFGNQEYPKVATKLGTDVSNRKTNAFGKSDEKALLGIPSGYGRIGKACKTTKCQCRGEYRQLLSEN